MSILSWSLFLEFIGNKEISNKDSYIEGMNYSLGDKAFFNDIVDFDVIVDFGCADGSFLEYIKNINPGVEIIGYDIDDEMIKRSKSKLGNKVLITNDWNKIISKVQYYKKPLLNLSSVIHEVYSYSTSKGVKDFWDNKVFGNEFRWIVIRDMIPSVILEKNDITKYKDDARKVRLKSDKKHLLDFESIWGSINTNYRTFIHYILKYRFIDNWEREVGENYVPITVETLKNKIKGSYIVVYERNFILPFLKKQVKVDFGIDLYLNTHTKIIIKNKKFNKN